MTAQCRPVPGTDIPGESIRAVAGTLRKHPQAQSASISRMDSAI